MGKRGLAGDGPILAPLPSAAAFEEKPAATAVIIEGKTAV
jgi:hypothetical protein